MSPYSYHLLFIVVGLLPNISQSIYHNGFLQRQSGEECGSFDVPFPFHVSSKASCGSDADPFRLSCLNSTSLFLNIASQSYRVLQFFTDGVLVDFPNTSSSSCRHTNDLNSFGFQGNDYFGISTDNVVGLYDCQNSSLCKPDCLMMPGCDGGCCFPLSSNPSAWSHGFSQFGCRRFSCWVDSEGGSSGGVKLEWAIPNKSSCAACAANAHIVNAQSVPSGTRCKCLLGFVGDGFAQGLGCFKSCLKDGMEAYATDCYTKKHHRTRMELLAGILASVFSIASLTALICLLKRPTKSGTFDPDQPHRQSTIPFHKTCRTRLFCYHELEEATKGFEDGQKLVDGNTKGSTLYAGVLLDGTHIAVQKVECESERDLLEVLSQVEVLSAISHRSMARVLGCSIDSGYTPLVVYEYFANGTLEEHLRQKTGLEWYKRLKIAAETASVLAFLQCEISPPILHHHLQTGFILLDEDFSAKIAGVGLLLGDGSHFNRSSDVYNLGLVLLEIIMGPGPVDLPTIALQKIRSGKMEEIVDPLFDFHEQPTFWREQIEKVADLATRCLLFGGDHGKLGMVDVARELVQITKESCVAGGSRRGPELEETFSNSSLLQMISMSPDSIYVP